MKKTLILNGSPRRGGDTAALVRSLSMVAELPLPDETQVYPGHESFTTLGRERRSNPCLRGEWF